MNHAAHIRDYWKHKAELYRRLHWWRAWEVARSENQRYALLAIGIIEDDLDEYEEDREANNYVAEGGQFGMGA